MHALEYTFRRDGEFYVGHLNRYPYYETQGYSKEELIENLTDLLVDIQSDKVPYITKAD
jgi:hypothetical protein